MPPVSSAPAGGCAAPRFLGQLLHPLPKSQVVRFSFKGAKIFSSIMAGCRLMT
jgi:hypothetical protein